MSDNAAQTRPQLTQDDVRAEIMLAWLAARTILAYPAEEMLEAYSRAHAAGPIVDPALYRDRMKAASEDETVVRILARAKRALLAAFPGIGQTAGSGYDGISRQETREGALNIRQALEFAADAERVIEEQGLESQAGVEPGYGHGV